MMVSHYRSTYFHSRLNPSTPMRVWRTKLPPLRHTQLCQKVGLLQFTLNYMCQFPFVNSLGVLDGGGSYGTPCYGIVAGTVRRDAACGWAGELNVMSRGDRNTLSGRGRATPDVRLPYCPTVTASCLLQVVNKGRRALRRELTRMCVSIREP